MEFIKLEIPDVVLIRPKVFEDSRGFFMEFFRASVFREAGISFDFVQDNHSRSSRFVLRGFHYQLRPAEQGKLVKCVRGRVLDVAVDIRKNSPWYGKYVAVELSEYNRLMLWIPPGFAHAFLALDEENELIYKVTKEYSPEHERGIVWNDPQIGVRWGVENPILSEKDRNLPPLKDAENNFFYGQDE